MIRQPVVSSNIRSIGFDLESKVLEIEFHSRAIYHYFGVPESLYNALMSAPSPESFFHQNIRSRFRYSRIIE